MAQFLRHLTLLAVGLRLLWPAAPLCAQTTSPATAKDGLSFTVYAPVESPAWDRLYYLVGPKEPIKLVFQNNRRSKPITITGAPKPLVFCVERIDPVSHQKTYLPIGEAAWPESAVNALVVFTASSGTNPQVRVTGIDDDLKVFPVRSVRFFNVTDVPLLAKVAEFQGKVPPGISPAHPYTVKSEDPSIVGVFSLAIAINDPKQGPRLLYNGNGDAWPRGRSLVFILPFAQGSTDLRLRVLVDTPPST